MSARVMLDASPLGRLAHPRPRTEDLARLHALRAAKVTILLPEIADYEIRRNLLLHNLNASLRELDRLSKDFVYVPLTTSAMRRAAEFWAAARRVGKPSADRHALDGDVILAAQALEMDARVVTENIAHVSRYVAASSWQDLSA